MYICVKRQWIFKIVVLFLLTDFCYESTSSEPLKCPLNCKVCDYSSNCFICREGYYGDTCNLTCSLCRPSTSCAQYSGHCEHSCKDGFSGNLCDKACSNKCLTCDRSNNSVCESCKPGHIGVKAGNNSKHLTCHDKCPKHCAHDTCHNESGNCEFGCKATFYGEKCDNKCSLNCVGGTCLQNGSCSRGCKKGFSGSDCSKNCSDDDSKCLVCFGINGGEPNVCTRCVEGFYPDFNGSCLECPIDCYDDICDPLLCKQNRPVQDNKTNVASVAVIGSAVGGAWVITVVITVTFVMFIRRWIKKKNLQEAIMGDSLYLNATYRTINQSAGSETVYSDIPDDMTSSLVTQL